MRLILAVCLLTVFYSAFAVERTLPSGQSFVPMVAVPIMQSADQVDYDTLPDCSTAVTSNCDRTISGAFRNRICVPACIANRIQGESVGATRRYQINVNTGDVPYELYVSGQYRRPLCPANYVQKGVLLSGEQYIYTTRNDPSTVPNAYVEPGPGNIPESGPASILCVLSDMEWRENDE